MANEIAKNDDYLKEANRYLELKVEQRTAEFKRINEDLVNKTKELTESQNQLQKAKEAAMELAQMKSDFLANMSHEIRTPLNAIVGFSELVLRSDLSEKQRDYLEKIRNASNTLLGIINNILDFSKIEAGKLSIEYIDFDLYEVLDNISDIIGIKAEKKGLELLFNIDKNVPIRLIGDPLRLGEILINFCDNAIKFTESGEIVVKCECDLNHKDLKIDKDNIMLKFSVSDTGIGIPQENFNKLFQSFSQVDASTTRRFGGTGLGLSICKKLIDMMDGEIGVESEYGKGSTFYFTVPFGQQPEKDLRHFSDLVDLRGMRIMVVDDNYMSRQILYDALTSFIFDVTQVASGEEAVSELEKGQSTKPFDLVLMDYKMPGINGIEAIKRIKNNPKISDVSLILMVTAYGHEEIICEAEKIGVDATLIKPVNQFILFDTIMKKFSKKNGKVKRKNKEIITYDKPLKEIKGAKVLLVEDNMINQQVAKELLEKIGLFVDASSNGLEAVSAVQKKDYDIIFMDIQMPVMDGYETVAVIRDSPKGKDVPIIAMTAHAMEETVKRCLTSDMNAHLSKPLEYEKLVNILIEWIKPVKRDIPFRVRERVKHTKEAVFDIVLPGLDYEKGLQNLDGNKGLYLALLRDFYADFSDILFKINGLFLGNNFDEIKRIAHTIKGISANIGAYDLQEASSHLEISIMENRIQDIKGLIESFNNSFEILYKSVARLLEVQEEEASVSINYCQDHNQIDILKLESLFKGLATLLTKGDTESKDYLSAIKEMIKNTKYQYQLRELEEKISLYMYSDAFEALKALAFKLNISVNNHT